jgi:aryl-alcohol dehydrogenase-like predicted oxidoreductase
MKDIKKIILGSAQFGSDYGISNINGKPSQIEIFDILSLAYNNGIRYIDTAEAYGEAHKLIGDFHKSNPDKRFEINTKLPKSGIGNVEFIINKYLFDLNIRYIETLLFHSFQSYYNYKSSIDNLMSLKRLGLIKKIGVSVYTNEEIEKVIEDKNIDLIQAPFNLFDNINKRGKVFDNAIKRGKKIQIRSVFLQGLFFLKPNSEKNITKLLANELDILRIISTNSNLSISTIALNYSLDQPLIDSLIIGVNSKEELLDNILQAKINIPLNITDQINSIDIFDINNLNPSKWD